MLTVSWTPSSGVLYCKVVGYMLPTGPAISYLPSPLQGLSYGCSDSVFKDRVANPVSGGAYPTLTSTVGQGFFPDQVFGVLLVPRNPFCVVWGAEDTPGDRTVK